MTSLPAEDWSQIADLRPQLRGHIRTYPQDYRGERWYVLHDESKGRHLRFNAPAYSFIAHLNGDISVQQIWDQIQKAQGEDVLVDQQDILMILTQLFAIDALRSGLPADAKEFFKRCENETRLRRKRTLMNPLAVRLPLFDPDELLGRMVPWVRPLFSTGGALLWLFVVGMAVLLGIANYNALHAAMGPDILSPANLLLITVMYVLIKALHEFAHALSVKMWGGEVHEMGITLLVLAPVPYVDASAAWGFRDKYKRIMVGAAGILTELFLAAVALFVWLTVEPGIIRDAAFNVMLIGSVSTLLFNANPLMRYDGYYILQDLVEIPNLYTRASRYYLYLIQRYLFGMQQVRSPVTASGESVWFAVYGLSAFFYRLFIMVVIVLFLAKEYLFIGVALGSWSVIMQVVLPLLRGARFLFSSPGLEGRRHRAALVSILLTGGTAAGLLMLPVSLTTHAEGVVWVPEQAQVFAGADGFVGEVRVASGTRVEPGTLLMQLRLPSLETRIAILKARHRELDLRHAAERLEQKVESAITAEEIKAVDAELALLDEQKAAQEVRSRAAGIFVMPDEQTLRGSYVHKGQQIGYIIAPERLIVRSVVPQSSIGLVRQQVERVEVRLAERLDRIVEAGILRETPSGSANLPSRALGAAGGGEIAVRRDDDGGTTAAEKVFEFDLSLPTNLKVAGVGERAYIRFDHGSEPLARQWLRSARQLVLSRLSL